MQFKDVQGYENFYEVTSTGLVRNKKTGQFLKQSLSTKGYTQVSLYVNQRVITKAIHRLMMISFNPIENQKNYQVNHINGIRTDVRLENLEWVSNRENASHSVVRHKKRTSNYPGVCFSSKHGRYMAQVYHNKKNVYLGLFIDEHEAYQAVCDFHDKNNIENRYIRSA